MNWRPSEDGHQLLSSEGYAIRAEGRPFPEAEQHERWFTAFDPSGREIASGYMHSGLAKCQRYCARHLERSLAGESQPEITAQVAPPISNNAAQPCSNNIAAPASTNFPTSPAQTALF